MKIIGIRELLTFRAAPHMEMYNKMLKKEYGDDTHNNISKEYREELDNTINLYISKDPYLKVIYDIEELGYGKFIISFSDNVISNEMESALTFLFDNSVFTLEHESLRFYNKDTKKESTCNYVTGSNMRELCKNYLNRCMNSNTLIRYKNDKGNGYATDSIRRLILNSDCISVRICIN